MTAYYDVARITSTMGVRTTVELDPTKVTVRVKNSIKKQLREGFISGGYRSQAAKIAEALTASLKLPVARTWWRGVVISNVPQEVRKEVWAMYEADWAAELLERPHIGRNKYYLHQYEETKKNLLNGWLGKFNVTFQDPAFATKAREFLAKSMTAADREIIEKAIDRLDGTEIIHLITYQ